MKIQPTHRKTQEIIGKLFQNNGKPMKSSENCSKTQEHLGNPMKIVSNPKETQEILRNLLQNTSKPRNSYENCSKTQKNLGNPMIIIITKHGGNLRNPRKIIPKQRNTQKIAGKLFQNLGKHTKSQENDSKTWENIRNHTKIAPTPTTFRNAKKIYEISEKLYSESDLQNKINFSAIS